MIPIKCQLCEECNREEEYCEFVPLSKFEENCDEFKFEPLYLIDYLEERLDKKDKYYNIEYNPAMENDFKWKVGIIDRIINSEEVLRETLKFRINWCQGAIDIDTREERLTTYQIKHLQTQIGFYIKQLEKLASGGEKECEHPIWQDIFDSTQQICLKCGLRRERVYKEIEASGDKTEKKELCKECLYKDNFDDNTCGACKPNTPQSRFKLKEKKLEEMNKFAEYPEKLAEYIDKLDFNNMDFAEEMKGIWDLAQEELILVFTNKIESMRVKFADITKNYTTMDLMNELWDYQRELKKRN